MWIAVAALVVVALVVLAPVIATFYTEWLWFDSIGQGAVFTRTIGAQVVLFALGAGIFLVLAMTSLFVGRAVARRMGALPLPREGALTYIVRVRIYSADRLVTYGALGCALALAAIMGSIASSRWLMFLRFLDLTPFGVSDPLFHADVSFFVFQLPVYRFIQEWLLAAMLLIGAMSTAYYLVRSYGFSFSSADLAALAQVRGVRVHLSAIAALVSFLLALGYRLDMYDLVYAHRGAVHGAGFADVHAGMPALALLSVVAAVMGALIFLNAFRRGYALAAIAVAGWIILAILAGSIYPALVQQYEVQPSEVTQERPYLQANLAMTRRAFGLDHVQTRPFPGEPDPRPGVVERNPQTFASIRLWDHRPLLATLNQIQTLRLYYDFNDVDVDRYTIDGQYTQVMLSARELSPERLAAQARTWVTQHLQFTHGYGLVMSAVNSASDQGLPDLLIQDIPPTGKIPVTRPEIYFGETTASYVIVDTSAPEFDYPRGDQNVYRSYAGTGGVLLNSVLRRLAFAIRYQDPNILLTSYLLPRSRILYHRQITERLSRLAPFLVQDHDPYLVVADGQLYWFQDAYTVSDRYPYSTPYGDGRFNYIRNSVKVVTNAYDGSVTLYIADPNDPIIQTYARIFPGLFKPISEMPADLRAHVRYPEGLFLVQADVLRTYHMNDPQVFYNREDLWDIPQENGPDGVQPIEPYYVITRPPGEEHEEFLLMLPFTPSGKKNLVAWLAASSDGANYGKLLLFEYPKDRVNLGPEQIEASIDEDPGISAQLSLWNQQGSKVVRGNLLVLPIEDSTLYVEPLYLQASQGQIPELKRVIVATQDRLIMASTLRDGLDQLFKITAAGGPAPTLTTAVPPVISTPGPPPTPAAAGGSSAVDIAALTRSAQAHYQKAQEYLKAGDWAGYGREQKALADDLERLVTLTSGQASRESR
jgi:uncharacterized membrane protein (UPF0182 family)